MSFWACHPERQRRVSRIFVEILTCTCVRCKCRFAHTPALRAAQVPSRSGVPSGEGHKVEMYPHLYPHRITLHIAFQIAQ